MLLLGGCLPAGGCLGLPRGVLGEGGVVGLERTEGTCGRLVRVTGVGCLGELVSLDVRRSVQPLVPLWRDRRRVEVPFLVEDPSVVVEHIVVVLEVFVAVDIGSHELALWFHNGHCEVLLERAARAKHADTLDRLLDNCLVRYPLNSS